MMKFTLVCGLVLVAANAPAVAVAQTRPAPPIAGPSAKAQKRSNIPPAPAISRLRSRSKRATSSKSMGAYHTPGHDLSGRSDMSGKAVGFYPAAKGETAVDPRKQSSAIKPNTHRVAKPETPK